MSHDDPQQPQGENTPSPSEGTPAARPDGAAPSDRPEQQAPTGRTQGGPAVPAQDEQPAAAPVEANVPAEQQASGGVGRRTLLIGGGAAALAAAVGGVAFVRNAGSEPAQAAGATVTKSWADRQLLITTPSGACDAPLVIAYEKGFFKEAGLKVALKKAGTDEDVTAAVGSGKYVAANGIFFNFLGPIYNGTPVKMSGGLHYGCLDLYVRNDGSVPDVKSLRGKRIGVSQLQGSQTSFFSLDLLDAGINSSPAAKQVEWVVIEQDLLPKALRDKRVDAIATAGGFLPIIQGVKAGWAKLLSDNRSISKNANYPCCAVALNNDFVSEDPVTAGKLVSAWGRGARWAGANLEETARIESEKKYVAGKPEEILEVLKTLSFRPNSESLHKQLEPGIAKFVKTGFLPANTDPKQLADKAFVDLKLDF